MGAALSVGKSSMYASHADMRRTLRRMQWGARLDEDRGGSFHHSFLAGIYGAEELVSIASDIIGQRIEFSREKPEGHTVCVDVSPSQIAADYPIYLTVPASILPGMLAYRIASALRAKQAGKHAGILPKPPKRSTLQWESWNGWYWSGIPENQGGNVHECTNNTSPAAGGSEPQAGARNRD